MSPPFLAARDVCRRHAKSFYFASFFLRREKRFAAYAVYAFCRMMDDAVDEAAPAEAAGALDGFCRRLDEVYADALDVPPAHPLRAFAATVAEYDIPKAYFLDLAEGCRMDLTVSGYADWPELERYCYRVAGVVGLIMSRVFRLPDPSAESAAVAMGNAMQLTNILRDVREDWDRGRLYLPQDELGKFGVSASDLSAGRVTPQFRELMRFQIARARDLYAQGAAGLPALPADGSRGTAAVMAAVYGGILDDIERRGYDVFSGRAHLSTWEKLKRLRVARRMGKGEHRTSNAERPTSK